MFRPWLHLYRNSRPVKRARWPLVACVLAAALGLEVAIGQVTVPVLLESVETHSGMAEASAAAALDGRHWVVAEDECNVLRVYRMGDTSPMGPPIDLRPFVGAGDNASDIEDAARIGDVVYWVASHSRNRQGKVREGRHRFFATRIEPGSAGGIPSVVPIGVPYTKLVEDMRNAPGLKDLEFKKAARKKPEEKGGLNIEGLAAGDDGSLWIGFRNPLRKGKAIMVALKNPAEVVQGAAPDFGKPVLLQLGGRGIRSIARIGDGYWIVAGPIADGGSFALYRWSGRAGDAPRPGAGVPAGFQAEAMVALAPNQLILLSDDGATQPEVACGSAAKETQRFRAIRYKLD